MQLGMIGLARAQPSRGNADFANRALSAMRYEFGGHAEKPAS